MHSCFSWEHWDPSSVSSSSWQQPAHRLMKGVRTFPFLVGSVLYPLLRACPTFPFLPV